MMWPFCSIFLLLVALSIAAPAPQVDANPVVNLGYAQFRGISNATTKVSSWYGLYFAASPEGAGRWSPPIDIEERNRYTSKTIYNATSPGPACFQQLSGWSSAGSYVPQSEDCLLLNVHKPSEPASANLPVLVLIHGGGYAVGSAIAEEGPFITSISKGQLIFVEIQYRLGAFGFLNNKEIRNNGTGNAGLLDQRAALGWVQRNIAAFGGDPSKVTVDGGSAGGGSVTAQLQLFGGVQDPPFRAAIAEYPWWQTFHDETIYSKQYTDILNATKCINLACLRALPYSEITGAFNSTTISAYNQGVYGHGDFYFGPGVDGTVIRDLPHAAYASGRFSKVPMMVNHDALEGVHFTNFTNFSTSADLNNDLRRLWPQFSTNTTFLNQLNVLYPTSAFTGPTYFPQTNSSAYCSSSSSADPIIAAAAPNTSLGAVLSKDYPGFAADYTAQNPYPFKRSQLFGDAFVSCPTRVVAAAGARYPSQMPVWKLIFNSGVLEHGAVYYAQIGQSLGAVAGNPSAAQLQAERSHLQAYYLSFATDLDPNANTAFAARPKWDQYGAGANVMFDNFTTFAQGPDTDRSPRCDFFAQYGDVIRS